MTDKLVDEMAEAFGTVTEVTLTWDETAEAWCVLCSERGAVVSAFEFKNVAAATRFISAVGMEMLRRFR